MIGVFVAATLWISRILVEVTLNLRRDCTTALGVTIKFRDDDCSKVRTILESLRLSLCRLTYRCIKDHDRHILLVSSMRIKRREITAYRLDSSTNGYHLLK